jgi:hypothetical protein
MVFVAGVLLRHVLGPDRNTRDAILGGVCVYLLMGSAFYNIFCLVEIASPGAFLAGGELLSDYQGQRLHDAGYPELLYFSFVTLTTLGYGDVTPVSPFARSLSTAAAVTGQLYLTILMAALVGMHIAERRNR